MSECSAWKKQNQNPVISFADVMSEELADSIAEEDRRKGNDIVRIEKTINSEPDKIDLAVGDLRSAPINDHVFNSLCQFSKADTKRSHKLKDKEEKATMNISVDAITRLTLFKWINQGVFDRVEGVVATGKVSTDEQKQIINISYSDTKLVEIHIQDKVPYIFQTYLFKESAVLHAIKGNNDGEHIVIKVYKTSLTEFKNRSEYVDNDFRFKNPRRVLRIWAEREFMNLTRMIHHDLPCPVPLKLRKNLLVMSLIGEWGIAAPKLKNVSWEETISDDRKAIFIQVVNIMCNMYEKCHLVHGDLSEFNLLFSNKKVEQLLHHNHSIRAVKSKPADFEWTAYNCEKIRGESPAREYN
uniref:non-specific serine/threonine protein kinase n=1 Tax=Heterorhabditis bacteriophora TaxID=37862 RepID=A0A1I7X8N6_HETBA